jgi:hypothetical protein
MWVGNSKQNFLPLALHKVGTLLQTPARHDSPFYKPDDNYMFQDYKALDIYMLKITSNLSKNIHNQILKQDLLFKFL